MRDIQAAYPEWAGAQTSGRALWWDKPQDPQLDAAFAQAKETARAYPYDVGFNNTRQNQ
jgi:hypothetical protein